MALITDVHTLKASLTEESPPAGLEPALSALWWSAKTQFNLVRTPLLLCSWAFLFVSSPASSLRARLLSG